MFSLKSSIFRAYDANGEFKQIAFQSKTLNRKFQTIRNTEQGGGHMHLNKKKTDDGLELINEMHLNATCIQYNKKLVQID